MKRAGARDWCVGATLVAVSVLASACSKPPAAPPAAPAAPAAPIHSLRFSDVGEGMIIAAVEVDPTTATLYLDRFGGPSALPPGPALTGFPTSRTPGWDVWTVTVTNADLVVLATCLRDSGYWAQADVSSNAVCGQVWGFQVEDDTRVHGVFANNAFPPAVRSSRDCILNWLTSLIASQGGSAVPAPDEGDVRLISNASFGSTAPASTPAP